MRRHRRFEFLAGEYLKQEGYQTEVTQGTADWGVDVFADFPAQITEGLSRNSS